MGCDLRSVLKDSLSLLKTQLDGSIVYLDEIAAECITLSVGFDFLFHLGILNIHSLSQASQNDAAIGALLSPSTTLETNITPDVVSFITTRLGSVYERMISLIKLHPKCQRIWIFCCYSMEEHGADSAAPFGYNAFVEYERKLCLESGRNESLKIHIRYCPWLFCCVTSQAYILPSSQSTSNLGFQGEQKQLPVLYKNAEREEGIQLLSRKITAMASHLGYKLDVYTLGPDAHAIGTEVMKMGVPVGLKEEPPEKIASLILIDRSFDLVSPLHHADTLLDRIVAAIEAKSETSSSDTLRLMDLNVTLITGKHDNASKTCLFAADPVDLSSLLNHLFSRTSRDGSLYIRKWIREEIRSAGLRSEYKPKAGAPNKEEFSSGVDLLQNAVHSSKTTCVRALAAFTAQALDTDIGIQTRFEIVNSNEKQILNMPSVDDTVQYFLDLLSNMSKPSAWLRFQDVCCLLAFALSILSDDTDIPLNSTEQTWIVDALAKCALSDSNIENAQQMMGLKSNVDSVASKNIARSALQERWENVRKLAASRKGLKQLRRLTPPLTAEHRPLVQQLVSLILENKEIHDLKHESSTLQGIFEATGGREFLSKGLSRLGIGKQQTTSVGGHDMVMVYVVGGISLHEINSVSREIEENGKGPWKPTILIGSDALLTPERTVYKTWNFK